MGSTGLYTHTVKYERDPGCPICSPGVPVEADPEATLQEVGTRGTGHWGVAGCGDTGRRRGFSWDGKGRVIPYGWPGWGPQHPQSYAPCFQSYG